MNEKIDKAIENLMAIIQPNIKADEAQKFAQAALNLAHVKSTLVMTELEVKRQGAGA